MSASKFTHTSYGYKCTRKRYWSDRIEFTFMVLATLAFTLFIITTDTHLAVRVAGVAAVITIAVSHHITKCYIRDAMIRGRYVPDEIRGYDWKAEHNERT